MRHPTLVELAHRDGIVLPDSLEEDWPPVLSAADEKGWFRFQRLYDVARSVLRTEDDVRRLVLEAAEDDVRDGGRWLEIQVDPSGYAARFGGISAFTDLVLDSVRDAAERTGLGIAVIIAANRTRHPMDARTLARLAVRYADHGVVGFGLSNDERRGTTAEFAPAFAIAGRGGLALMPHGGELMGPESVRTCLDSLHADRLGHGIRATEDPALLERIVDQGVALEVCPVSNVALGVYSDLTSVPLPQLLEAGATVALGADDPLLFGSRLAGQYATMRAAHELTDEQLAELARMSVRASRAPSDVVNQRGASSACGLDLAQQDRPHRRVRRRGVRHAHQAAVRAGCQRAVGVRELAADPSGAGATDPLPVGDRTRRRDGRRQ
jgi:adenosine deaminase